MAVNVSHAGADLVLSICGAFDLGAARQCVNALRALGERTHGLRFDLSACTYLGAPGIGAMLHLQGRYGALDRRGVITLAGPELIDLIELCDLERWFVVEHSRGHAGAAHAGRGA